MRISKYISIIFKHDKNYDCTEFEWKINGVHSDGICETLKKYKTVYNFGFKITENDNNGTLNDFKEILAIIHTGKYDAIGTDYYTDKNGNYCKNTGIVIFE